MDIYSISSVAYAFSSYRHVYGYLVNRDWLYRYGVDKGITYEPEDYEPRDIQGGIVSTVMSMLEDQAGLPVSWATVPSKRSVTTLCLTFAGKAPQDTRPVPPDDSLDCIKKILGTEKNPKWYPCYSISIAPQISYFREVYGYLVDREWLYEYAVNSGAVLDFSHYSGEDPDIKGSFVPGALAMLRKRAGVPAFWSSVPFKDGLTFCLTFASNDPSDVRPVPSEGSLDRIKKILKTNKSPKWYPRDD